MKKPIIGRLRFHVTVPLRKGKTGESCLEDSIQSRDTTGEVVEIEDVWVEICNKEKNKVTGVVSLKVRTPNNLQSKDNLEELLQDSVDITFENGSVNEIVETTVLGVKNNDDTIQEVTLEELGL